MLNFDWLSGLSPTQAKAVFLGLFVLIGVLVMRVPSEELYAGLEHPRWYHNLRIWAVAVLAMIFVTYLIF